MQSCKHSSIKLFKFETPLYYTRDLVHITPDHWFLELLLFSLSFFSGLHILLGSKASLMFSEMHSNCVKSKYVLLSSHVDPTILNLSKGHCWALVGHVDYERRKTCQAKTKLLHGWAGKIFSPFPPSTKTFGTILSTIVASISSALTSWAPPGNCTLAASTRVFALCFLLTIVLAFLPSKYSKQCVRFQVAGRT